MGDAKGAERVDDGVHDGGERADIAGLAGALRPSVLVLVGTAIVRYRQDASTGGLIRCRPLPFRKANGNRERLPDGGLAKDL